MADVVLKHIDKVYEDSVHAVTDFNLEIHDKEFLVLVGASGCGKSTLLRMIAGLEDISSGELLIDGQLMNDIEPRNRDIAMVFQNYALYPHMTVYDNMAFALKMRKVPKDQIDQKVREAAKILGLSDLLDRKPKALSGGQRQRVAMGRAIVRNPKVFLMDEPLSNLDAKLRVQMRMEISNLHRNLEATIIYVTHDQVEAMTLGSRIVVMKDGRIQQVASPQDLYQRPANMYVAGFIGSPQMNFLTAQCHVDDGKICADTSIGSFLLSAEKSAAVEDAGQANGSVIIGLRPEDISIVPDATGAVTVRGIEILGSEMNVFCEVGADSMSVNLNEVLSLQVGDHVSLSADEGKIHIFDADTQMAIAH